MRRDGLTDDRRTEGADAMTTLYVVTSRCFADEAEDEDRHVEQIFSTREKAEEWLGPETTRSTYAIEERTLDDPGPVRPKLIHNAYVRIDDGSPHGQRVYMPCPELVPHDFISGSDVYDRGVNYSIPLAFARSTISPEHALQLAQETRTKYLADRADPLYYVKLKAKAGSADGA
jgi:hypothetical protein